MSNPYERVKGGKLVFKGGLGPEKAIVKKKHSKKNKKQMVAEPAQNENPEAEKQENNNNKSSNINNGGSVGYPIDAAARKNYEELFPVETRKFGYAASNPKSAEETLDERVKKKADRYCKWCNFTAFCLYLTLDSDGNLGFLMSLYHIMSPFLWGNL